MRTLLTALTALMLFATPAVAGDWEDGIDAYKAGDFQKVFRLWKPLAEQGDASAQYNLGVMYYEGQGVPEDNAKAVHWHRKAATQGHAKAQYDLGMKYKAGEGVSEDDAKAAYWWRKAAEQGYANAQVNLGFAYAKGEGVPEDFVRAYAWTSIAAAQGGENAKKNKGIIKGVMTSAQIAKGQELSSEYWEKYVVPFQN